VFQFCSNTQAVADKQELNNFYPRLESYNPIHTIVS